MQRFFLLTAAALVTLTAQAASTPAFQKQTLTDQFWSEGAHFGDLNHDGAMDIISGPFWYEGPSFTQRHEYRPATANFKRKGPDGAEQIIPGFEGGLGTNNAYSDNFFTFTDDFNGDGWIDILIVGMPGENSFWFENPKGREGHWQRRVALDVVDNESPVYADINGDGFPELVCNSKGFFGFAGADRAHPDRPWTFHPVSPNNNYHKYTHGLGVGDVNGDGRMDLLEKDGWWEQPASLTGDPLWKHHPFVFSPPTDAGVPVGGAQMYAYDVNGDGRNDVITCLAAHGYGLVWWEQNPDGTQPAFKQHIIINKEPRENPQGVAFSQPHAIELVDMNGDGLKDIVTGKRFWAHGPQGDPDPNGPALLYWFELQRGPQGAATFIPHLIDNNSGVGTQVTVGDLNGDHRPDVVVGNKKGTFALTQQAPQK